jgi:nucleoside 2-deoxyribosyltransferase
MVFEEDDRMIRQCDILLIVLDGRTVDEGAAFELGLAYGLGKDCYGIQTDVRRLLPYGNNPMIRYPLTEVFGSLAALEAWAQKAGSRRSRSETGA